MISLREEVYYRSTDLGYSRSGKPCPRRLFFFFWTLTAVHVNGVRRVGNPAGYKIRPCFPEFLRHERMEALTSSLRRGDCVVASSLRRGDCVVA